MSTLSKAFVPTLVQRGLLPRQAGGRGGPPRELLVPSWDGWKPDEAAENRKQLLNALESRYDHITGMG